MAKSRARDVWNFNFAQVAEIRQKVEAAYKDRCARIRRDRQPLNDTLMQNYNMWNLVKDGNHTYNGRASLYIPEVRKSVESQARKLTIASFPNDDYFDVTPGRTGTKKGSLLWKSIMRHHMTQSTLPLKYFAFQRQNVMMGTSPVKYVWRKDMEHIFRSHFDRKTRKVKPTRTLVELYNGPEFLVRDILHFYAFNPFKPDLEEGCFEDVVVGYFDLLKREKDGNLHGLKELVEKASSNAYQSEEMQQDLERIEAMGLAIGNEAYVGEVDLSAKSDTKPSDRSFVLTTIYDRLICPEMCEEDEDKDMPVQVEIEMVNGCPTLIRRNPFWHQRAPYGIGRYIWPNVNEFYGQGLPKAIQYLQYEMNSKAEQGMDSATLALNPLTFIDPALASQMGDFSIQPGATWFVSPQGVKFGQIPDVTPVAYQAINQLKTLSADYSDRNPSLPSQLAGKARSATQAQMVDAEISIDEKAFQMQMEQTVLIPMLKQWERLIDQNCDEKQVVMILGNRAREFKRMIVRKKEILGNYEYIWKAASFVAAKPVMSRQMLDFLKVESTMPPEARAKLNTQHVFIMKKLWTELWNLPDPDLAFGDPDEMESQDPEVEHDMVELGMEIEVQSRDHDEDHIKKHEQKVKELKADGKEDQAAELMIHIMKHARAIDIKKQAEADFAKQQQLQMAMAAAGAQPQNTSQGRRSQGSGNRAQLSPNANIGNMGSGSRA